MITIYYRIAGAYKSGFLGLFCCCVITLFLLPLILSVRDFYENYARIRLGFIPTVLMNIDSPYQANKINNILKEITTKYTIDHSLQGASCLLEHANFNVVQDVMDKDSMFETIHKNKMLLGIDFKGNDNITIQQDKQMSCKVIQMGEFGSWFMDIEKSQVLHEGNALLIDNQRRFHMHVSDRGDYYRLRYIETDTRHDVLFFDFLNRFVHQFQRPAYTGIGMDRYTQPHENDKEIKFFHIYLKRHILAYASLIFPSSSNYVPAIVSSDLLHSINKYDYITEAILSSSKYKIPVLANEAFNLAPEQNMNQSMLLSNIHHFYQYIAPSDSSSFLYLYCNNKWTDDIVRLIHQKNKNAKCLTRKDIVPSYYIEKAIVSVSILTLFFLFVCVFSCILLIRLIKFYSVFQDDLTLLKLYGYHFSIFSTSLSTLTILAHGVAAGFLYQFIYWNNQLLEAYYFPSLFMNWTNLFYSSLICWAIIAVCYICEKQTLKQLSYTDRGKNQ
jgi:hypothetical protein